MKKILTTMLLLITLTSYGQEEATKLQKSVMCAKTEIVLKIVTEQFKEMPIFYGSELNTDKVKYFVSLNPKTGAWTIIQFDSEIACILGSGDRAELNFKDIFKDESNGKNS